MFQGWLLVAACAVGTGPDLAGVGKLKLEPPCRVGSIYIVGNDVTRHDIYLDLLTLTAGADLTSAELKRSQRRLAPLWLVGVRCTVTAREREGGSEYQDIVVTVRESPVTWVLGPVYQAIKDRVDLLLGW